MSSPAALDNPEARTARAGLPTLALILGAGLVLRLLFVGSTGFHNDIGAFESWTLTLRDNPPWLFYAKAGFADYPPGYCVLLWVLAKIYALLPGVAGDSANGWPVLRVLVKLPAIAMDLVNAYVVYRIVRRYAAENVALVASAVLALNPAAIYVSSYWGQVDSVSWGLVLIALWLVLRAGDEPDKTVPRLTLAWLGLAFSVLMKPQGATLALLLLAYPFAAADAGERARRLTGTALGLVAAFLLAGAVGLLFHPAADVYGWLFGRYAFGSNVYPYTSVNAFNLYALRMPMWSADNASISLFGVPVGSYATWGIGLVVAATLLIVGRYLQRRDDRALLEGAMLIALAFFVLATRMHERYVYGAFLLAMPLIAFGRGGLWSSVVLTVTMYLNLAYSLAYQTVMEQKITGVNASDLWPAISHPAAFANVALFFWMGYLYLGGAGETAVADGATGAARAEPSAWDRAWANVAAKARDWFDPREGTVRLTRVDWAILSALSFIGFAVALVHLGSPAEMYFDEVYFPLSAQQYLHGLPQREWTHPPLVKLVIALSIMLTGDHPFGWRFLNVLIGSLEIGLIYAFAKRLTSSTVMAAVAGVMLAFDGFHLAEERIATGEITIATLILATLYATYRFWLASQVRVFPVRTLFGRNFWITMALGIPLACAVAWLFNLQPPGHVISGFVARDINNTAGADARSYLVAFAYAMLGVYLFARLVVAPRSSAPSGTLATYPDGSAALLRGGKASWDVPQPPGATAQIARKNDGSMTYTVPSGRFAFSPAGTIADGTAELVRGRDAKLWFVVLCCCLGLLIASKWNGFFDLAVVLTVFAGVTAQRFLRGPVLFGNPRGFDLGVAVPAIAFACATIYGLSYVPTLVRDHGHTLADILALQWQMFYYHQHVTGTHPYMSVWWQWPIMQIPIVYYYHDFRTGADAANTAACCLAEIIALPNPLVFLAGLVSVPFTAWLAWRERNKGYALLALTYAFQWIPWMRSPRMLFEYHFFPNLAIIVLCNTVLFTHLVRRFAHPERVLAAYCALVVIAFAFFYPVVTGVPLSYEQWYARMLPDKLGIPYTSWILPHPNRQ
ncbi:MAG: phospholipid carrier-dependent glycosyltransferase [Candidatus Eremiobacteraeota bacterium]|nr:phospholipid carrier-dependent glycosyltransferase [Candidatus Eremiobacteraeota bacterium]